MNALEELRLLADASEQQRRVEVNGWLRESTREERLEDQRRDARIQKQSAMQPVLYGSEDTKKSGASESTNKRTTAKENGNEVALPAHHQQAKLKSKIMGKTAGKASAIPNKEANKNTDTKISGPVLFDRFGRPVKRSTTSEGPSTRSVGLSRAEKKRLKKERHKLNKIQGVGDKNESPESSVVTSPKQQKAPDGDIGKRQPAKRQLTADDEEDDDEEEMRILKSIKSRK